MKRLAWLLTLPLAVAVVLFAVHNRGPVPIDPWPVAQPFNLPLYLIVLGAILIGFIAGALVQWAAAGRRRKEARQKNRRLSELERDAAAAPAKTATGAANDMGRLPASGAETRLLAAGDR